MSASARTFFCAALVWLAIASPAMAQEKAGPEIVALFEEEFPKVMNATLIGRDCREHDKEAQRELNAAIDQLIAYADPKPELSSGVAKVFQGQLVYERERVDLGPEFCEKRAPEIVAEGLKSARLMLDRLGLKPWNPDAIDTPSIKARLIEASEAVGAFDKCKKWVQDSNVRGRVNAFVFMQRVVSDIRYETGAITHFLKEKGEADGLPEKLAQAEEKGRESGSDTCYLAKYAALETELENIVQRHGLQR